MKKLATVALLTMCLSITMLAQTKEKGDAVTLGGVFQRITDGQGSLKINPYGLVDSFTIDGVNNIHQFVNFVSINNGPIEAVNRPGWAVFSPLVIIDNTGQSSVRKGNTLQMDLS